MLPGWYYNEHVLKRMGPITTVLVFAGLLLVACGAGSPSGVASLGKTNSTVAAGGTATTLPSGATARKHLQEALEYSICMRSHGVPNFPDPGNGGGIEISSGSGIDPSSPQFQAAQKACQKYSPANPSQAHMAQREQSLLKFAACMRDNGVPSFPDPQFFPNGGILAKQPPGVNANSPTFQAAAKKCNA